MGHFFPSGKATAERVPTESSEDLRALAGAQVASTVNLQARGLNNVPADLPSNIPDADKYPQARYGGIYRFSQLLPPDVRWDFIVDIGGRRDETPNGRFWDQSFATNKMITAYFKLKTVHRVYFLQNVVWIRDPLPGRPGGVQIVPPEWPGNLPTPVHHVMTRYAGLARWVGGLADGWAEVARMSLFGIHERFDDVWWSDYHKTVDVYNLYSRLNPTLRNSFEEWVYWIPDGPMPKDPRDQAATSFRIRASGDGNGFCYLQLFREDHRDRIKRKLGENPWAAEVAAALLAEPGIWHPGSFTFSVTSRHSAEGQSFLQGHVEPDDGGVPIRHLLTYLSGTLRLGATNVNGFCYLQLFREDHRDRIGRKLGENPWAAEVAAALLAEPGIWYPGSFTFSVTSRHSAEGQSFLQGHVEPDADGVPIRHLLTYLSGILRLGATSDINALANLQLQDEITTKPTLFPTKPVGGGPGLEMVYNVYGQLNKTDNVLVWMPMEHNVFSWLFGAFESVRIMEARFTIQMSTGAANSLLCAICGPSVDLNVPSDWYAAPVNTEVHGSDQGYVTSTFDLPQPHPFETEIRSPDPTGNPTPSFRFNFAGVAGGKVMIKGMIKVKVNGQAVLGHIDIGPKAPKKAAARMRDAIVESLPYNVDGETKCDEEEDEEDSDDDAPAPTRTQASPPRANSSSVRT